MSKKRFLDINTMDYKRFKSGYFVYYQYFNYLSSGNILIVFGILIVCVPFLFERSLFIF